MYRSGGEAVKTATKSQEGGTFSSALKSEKKQQDLDGAAAAFNEIVNR